MTKRLQWPKGKHGFADGSGDSTHKWQLAEHSRDGPGYLQLLWVCPCGAYARQVLDAPYLDGTPVPDPLWEEEEAK